MADNSILTRLDGLKIKYEEIGQQMTDPEVIADVKKFVALNKEYKELQPIVETSDKYRTALNNLEEAKEILAHEKDEELREMARMEVAELEPALAQIHKTAKMQSSKSVEVRVVMKLPFLRVTCSACTPSSSRKKDGNMRSTALAKAARVVSRRLS